MTAIYEDPAPSMERDIKHASSTTTLLDEEITSGHASATSTPKLDALLSNPSLQSHLSNLTTAMQRIGSEPSTASAMDISKIVSAAVAEFKEAKKSGSMSKEERKVLKAEMKIVARECKEDSKGRRKSERRGWFW